VLPIVGEASKAISNRIRVASEVGPDSVCEMAEYDSDPKQEEDSEVEGEGSTSTQPIDRDSP